MVMINEVLAVLRGRLDNVLRSKYPQAEPWVLLGPVPSHNLEDSNESANKIILSLVGLHQDALTGSFAPPRMAEDDRYYLKSPPLYIDALVLIFAKFDEANYEAGLARLSEVIAHLQESPVLSHHSAPDLPDELDKLSIEFTNIDFAQSSHLLTMLGARYAPMALYRLRRLPFAGPAFEGVAPPVRSADAPRGTTGRS